MKELAGIATAQTTVVREAQYDRLYDLLLSNLSSDGEANGDQDGRLNINGFIFDGMKQFWHDHNLLAHVVTALYDEHPEKRERIIELIAVHSRSDVRWTKMLMLRALEDENWHVRVGALFAIEMWDAPELFQGLLWHLAGSETVQFVLDEYKSLFGIDRSGE